MQENKGINNALVSIILPVFNGERYLSESIESCIKQTYQNFELIIVNDCSTDRTLAIAQKYSVNDKRIKIITNSENKKLPSSLNIGHREATGDFITWTSDDNIYDEFALEVLLYELINNKVDIVYSNITLITHKGEKIHDVNFIDFENIIFGNFIGSCFLYRKEVFVRNDGYNEKLFLVEDYDFWLRAILHSRYLKITRNLYQYRKHNESLTNLIGIEEHKNKLWQDNIFIMYNNFSKMILKKDYQILGQLLTNLLTYQKINFEWLRKNDLIIEEFKKNIFLNPNFSDYSRIQKIFLKKTIIIMTMDQESKSNFLNSLFILKKYFIFLDKNSVKTLIKYSFFK